MLSKDSIKEMQLKKTILIVKEYEVQEKQKEIKDHWIIKSINVTSYF